jgi:outer membrane protein TolC
LISLKKRSTNCAPYRGVVEADWVFAIGFRRNVRQGFAFGLRVRTHNEQVQANLQHALANFNLGFDAARELDFCGRIQRNGTTAGASLLATVADYQNTRVSLTAEVAHTALTR